MAKKQRVSEIVFSTRIIEIGDESYSLANISRVRTHELKWAGKYTTFHPLRRLVWLALWTALIVTAAGVVPELTGLDEQHDLDQLAHRLVLVVLALAGVRAVWLVGLLLYRLLLRPTYYGLIIETAGAQYAALYGTNVKEIVRIKGEIVSRIENPPMNTESIQIHGDVFAGDNYTFNTAGRDLNQIHGDSNTINTYEDRNAAGLDAAVAELRALIARIAKDGAVTEDGTTITDPAAVVAAVQNNPTRLQALVSAISSGAGEAVLSAVRGGVAAMIVALLGH